MESRGHRKTRLSRLLHDKPMFFVFQDVLTTELVEMLLLMAAAAAATCKAHSWAMGGSSRPVTFSTPGRTGYLTGKGANLGVAMSSLTVITLCPLPDSLRTLSSSPIHQRPSRITKAVTGSAIVQYSHCPTSISRISAMFIPKTDAIVESGRKTTVTIVNAYIASS